jgi:hypothetical protein
MAAPGREQQSEKTELFGELTPNLRERAIGPTPFLPN